MIKVYFRQLVFSSCLLLSIAFNPGQAVAHAFLIDTQPQDNARLDRSPDEVVLRFNEPLMSAKLELLNHTGDVLLTDSPLKMQGVALTLPIPLALEKGIYRVQYKVTSGDGHLVVGQIQFGVGVTPESPAVSVIDNALSPWMVGVRGIHYIAMLAGLGGGLFVVVMGTPLRSGVLRLLESGLISLLMLAVGSGVLLTGLTGAALEAGRWSDLLLMTSWISAFQTKTAGSFMFVVTGVLFTSVGLIIQTPRVRALFLLFGALMAALSLAVTGHVGGASNLWRGVVLLFFHGLAVAFWVGSLWPLALILRSSQSQVPAQAVLQRFSVCAPFAVGTLVATGVGMSVMQGVTSLTSVTASQYGVVWLIKVSTVLLLIVVAVWNRFVLTPGVLQGRAQAFVRLRRNLRIEIVLVAVILGLSAMFSVSPPPRTQQTPLSDQFPVDPSTVYSTIASVEGWTVLVDIDPARVGDNQVEVLLSQAQDTPPPAKLVSEWQRIGQDGDSSNQSIRVEHDAYFRASVFLPESGRWRVSFRWDDASSTTKSVEFMIPVSR